MASVVDGHTLAGKRSPRSSGEIVCDDEVKCFSPLFGSLFVNFLQLWLFLVFRPELARVFSFCRLCCAE